MSSETKTYNTVEFVYTDNGQIFTSGAELTEEEVTLLGTILDRYSEAGAVDQASVRVPVKVEQDFDGVVNEIIEALKYEVGSEEKSQCQNCDRVWPDQILTPIEQVKNLHQRVSKGEPMPSGECPACGAFCQPVSE